MSTLTERQEELAALYSLRLLDGTELEQFEAELARRADLRDLVNDLTAASALLACTASGPAPSAALKSRILAHAPDQGSHRPAAFRPAFWLPLAAAAGFALAAAWFAQLYFFTRAENSLLLDQQAIADATLQSLRRRLETERFLTMAERTESAARFAALTRQMEDQSDLDQLKIATLVSMLDDSPQAVAVAVWNPALQEGMLTVEKLPALAADRDYQLWVIDPQYPIPVDGGVFTVDAGTGEARYRFKANKPVATVAKFAVSLERKGGVPKAEGPMVLIGP
jgi:anti-sigma-K factor RskA